MFQEQETMEEDNDYGVKVSRFDTSVDNHFTAIDKISKLCGETEDFYIEEGQTKQLSSSITFLSEWSYYNYNPRTVRFDSQSSASGIKLPKFSSAAVPKRKEGHHEKTTYPEPGHDFLFYAGGPVWALDWCPRIHERPDVPIKCEFIAVSAHPPDSSYHKLGALLTGRGMIQIWCVLVQGGEEKKEDMSTNTKKPKGRPRKKSVNEEGGVNQLTKPNRPRGRPRKPRVEPTARTDCCDELAQPLTLQHPVPAQPHRPRGRPRKHPRVEPVAVIDCDDELDQPFTVQHLVPAQSQLATEETKEAKCNGIKKPKRMTRKKPASEDGGNDQLTKPNKGRPRKHPRDKPVVGIDCNNQPTQPLTLQYPVPAHSQLAIVETKEGNCNDSKHSKRMPRKKTVNEESAKNQLTKLNRPSRKPKKHPRDEPIARTDRNDQLAEPLTLQCPILSIEGVSENAEEHVVKEINCSILPIPSCNSLNKATAQKRSMKRKARSIKDDISLPLLSENEDKLSFVTEYEAPDISGKEVVLFNDASYTDVLNEISGACTIPEDVALPRVVLCLAHNGKVAWDVKWRPLKESDSKCQHRMGYLAVLLGNGSLEVWDVPLPRTMKLVYRSSSKKGTDPRFVKVEPVFRCSMLKTGGTQSIPLTMEWSTSSHQDYLLAGCHDGTVALWKFSASGSCGDTKPFLCFSADTVPIRALAWAPVESDPEGANVILTAGHGGLKFWDIRDPFRPLWDIHPAPRFIYSLDWLADPGCVLLSLDDGTIRLLSLNKAAYDAPVHGKLIVGPKQLGLHIFNCSSSFAIWNVQVSKLTGMVAYCSADGKVTLFQLTRKEVEKKFGRNRAPHFVSRYLTEDESTIVINSESYDTPLILKKPINEKGVEAPRSMRDFLTLANNPKRSTDEKAKSSIPDNEMLAICYGDDPGTESGGDETLAAYRRKSISSKKKDRNVDQASVSAAAKEQEDTADGKKTGKSGNDEISDVIAPKMVAIHRVRWNMNKGSERWLCAGGAAGLVWCQEITVPPARAWK